MNYVIVIALIVGLGALLTVVTNMKETRSTAAVDASCASCSTGGCNACNFDTLKETLSHDSKPDIHLNPIKKA